METIQLQQERIQTQRHKQAWWSLVFCRFRLVLFAFLMTAVVLGIRFVSKAPSVDASVPDNHPAVVSRD